MGGQAEDGAALGLMAGDMFRFTNPGKTFFLIALIIGFGGSALAQEDCVYGYKIHVRDEAGKVIEKAKLELSGSPPPGSKPINGNSSFPPANCKPMN